jgi:hypothetical protein
VSRAAPVTLSMERLKDARVRVESTRRARGYLG